MTDYLKKTEMADAVMNTLEEMAPDLMAEYSELQKTRCRQDIMYHLEVLHQAVWIESPAIFLDYIEWTRVLFKGLGIDEGCLSLSLQALSRIFEEQGDVVACEYIKRAEESLCEPVIETKTFISEDPVWEPVLKEFIDYLLQMRRSNAHTLVKELYSKGTGLQELYLHLFQPALFETGRLWHTGVITVAHEHYCSSSIQQIIAFFYPDIMQTKKTGKRMIASCVSGELHEIGVRMVADFFELSGWETIYLGSNVPLSSIISLLKNQNIELLALSCTMSFHLNQVDEIIRLIRSDPEISHVKVIVGGYPFRTNPDLWKKLRADASAPDAQAAVQAGEMLNYR